VDLPISTEYEFADTLKSKYLNDPTSANKLDVSFDETNSRVTAARFLIQVSLLNIYKLSVEVYFLTHSKFKHIFTR
jgi:hypothetical protein